MQRLRFVRVGVLPGGRASASRCKVDRRQRRPPSDLTFVGPHICCGSAKRDPVTLRSVSLPTRTAGMHRAITCRVRHRAFRRAFPGMTCATCLRSRARDRSRRQPACSASITRPCCGGVNAFEERLGLRLFDRLPTGYFLTPAGAEMIEAARLMEDTVATLERRLTGQDRRLAGAVRVPPPTPWPI